MVFKSFAPLNSVVFIYSHSDTISLFSGSFTIFFCLAASDFEKVKQKKIQLVLLFFPLCASTNFCSANICFLSVVLFCTAIGMFCFYFYFITLLFIYLYLCFSYGDFAFSIFTSLLLLQSPHTHLQSNKIVRHRRECHAINMSMNK